jgi:tetratricopeptide (TPR) repeat protein
MIKQLLLVLMVSTLAVSCGKGGGTGKTVKKEEAKDQKIETAYQEMTEKRRTFESTAEKLAITKKFLDEYPESDQTASAVAAAAYYQGEDMGDTTGAVAYAEEIRGKIRAPEIAKAVDKEMLYIYGVARMFPKMIEVADRLSASGSLDFSDCTTIIESATSAGDWDLALQYCDEAGPFATAESYRRQYPEKKFTDEEIQKAVNNRAGTLLVMGGWARANKGEVDRALADFSKADGLVAHSYFGTGDYNLDTYWGETLLMKGDFEKAAEKLAVDALVMRDDKALAGLKQAYVGMHGDQAEFDAYAAALHREIAKPVGDFELADYAGNRHRLSDLRKDVTLLAFWFPT